MLATVTNVWSGEYTTIVVPRAWILRPVSTGATGTRTGKVTYTKQDPSAATTWTIYYDNRNSSSWDTVNAYFWDNASMPPLGENFTTGSSEEISICLALEPPSYSKYVSSVIPLMSGVCPLPLLKITLPVLHC